MCGVFIAAMAMPPLFLYTTLIPGLPPSQDSHVAACAAPAPVEYSSSVTSTQVYELHDADDTWSASPYVTARPDSTSYVEGCASASLKIADDFSAGLIAYHNIVGNNDNLNLSGCDSVTLWIKSSASLGDDTIQLKLSESYDSAGTAELLSIPGSTLDGKSWHRAQISLSGKDSNYDDVRSVALVALSDPGAVTIWLDIIETPSALSTSNQVKSRIHELVYTPVIEAAAYC